MNGAESLVRTLIAGDVDVCFANPGTSEMHFVAALDRVDGMRCVLGLFEGVVTGAADGYSRIAEKPAATLLHLGPGLANSAANLHNAKKASSPVVNIIGEHATYHVAHDSPLTADIEGIARPVSHWVKTSPRATEIAADAAEAIVAANTPPGQVASLILPADTAWGESNGPSEVPSAPARTQVSEQAIANAVRVLRSGEPTALVMTGLALREYPLDLAGRIAAATGAQVMAQGANARIQRGAGRVPVERVPFVVEMALKFLAPYKHVILIGAKPPVAFFAYPDKPSKLTPDTCEVHRLSGLEEDSVHALEWLADELGATGTSAVVQEAKRPEAPSGALTKESIAAALGASIAENAIVCDESVNTGRGFFSLTAGAPPHDWMNNMGGSIGLGLPMATGASVAAPERRVMALSGDGSAMYTLQALWTQAREGCNVTNVIFSNRTYEILHGELPKVGVQNPGPRALDMLDLKRPDLDFVSLANGMGVEASRVESADGLVRAIQSANQTEGPVLIDVVF